MMDGDSLRLEIERRARPIFWPAPLNREVVDRRARFVLAHGRRWGPARLRPKGLRFHAKKACWQNSGRTVIDGRWPEMIYVEGYAVCSAQIAIEHAWVADESGRVVELTWPAPGAAYFGVAFRPTAFGAALGAPAP